VTIRVDPSTGERAEPVDPLVRTWGLEAGARTQIIPDLTATLALFYLESDSELLFVGDAGNTEAGPSTRRYGVELAAYWRPSDWFTLDAEFALTDARFKSSEGGGKHIPNSVPAMFSGGMTIGRDQGPFASIRARYLSERPLIEDDSVDSDASFVVNARAGYRLEDFEFALELLNLFDSEDNDVEYFYTSRVPGEPLAGVDDIHLHPLEPRTFRMSVSYRF
jgi:outer membrane receptor protein involved in Fe transport